MLISFYVIQEGKKKIIMHVSLVELVNHYYLRFQDQSNYTISDPYLHNMLSISTTCIIL